MGQVRAAAVPGASGILINVDDAIGHVEYRGYALRATTTGILNIRAGTVAGNILDTVSLTAPAYDAKFYAFDSIRCEGDLFVEIVSGVWVGSIRYS